ncbi:MAG: hypothetical protein E7633_02785 [Ruminococcaceae bacterium]|nr:hypothetical protein [Oscillospiraceae bacterium]
MKKEKISFVPWLIILGAILLLVLVFVLSEFIDNYHYVRKFSFDYSTGELYDKKNDITYIEAPSGYEPIRISNKPYATDGERQYYQIGFLTESGKEEIISPSIAIATSPDDGAYIYYDPSALLLPDVKSFEAKEILVCDMNNNTLQSFDESETKTFLEAFENAKNVHFVASGSVFTLRLRSSKIPWMSYCMYLYIVGDAMYVEDTTEDVKIKLPSNVCKLFDEDLLKLFGNG